MSSNITKTYTSSRVYLIQSANGNPDSILQIGRGPVKGIKRMHSRLYICCGLEVVVVEVTKELRVVKTWKALDR